MLQKMCTFGTGTTQGGHSIRQVGFGTYHLFFEMYCLPIVVFAQSDKSIENLSLTILMQSAMYGRLGNRILAQRGEIEIPFRAAIML